MEYNNIVTYKLNCNEIYTINFTTEKELKTFIDVKCKLCEMLNRENITIINHKNYKE